MPFDSTSTSSAIALHQRAQIARDSGLGENAYIFGQLKQARPRKRSRIRPGHVFAAVFTAAVILIGWHMSDAFARAQADIRIIQSMEKVK